MSLFCALSVFALHFLTVNSQLAGTQILEIHPKLTWKKCTKGECISQLGEVVLDADSRWLHNNTNDCQTKGKWNTTICPDGITCAKNCAIEGIVKYEDYGIETNGNALTLKMNTKYGFGQRIYFMGDNKTYQTFNLLNQEFTFDVDMAKLPCGTNGALYFAEMDFDGGASKYPTNRAGAKYGTGYCDAQCPKSARFIHGEATIPHANGTYGACCNEMDIWEANKIATAYTPHPCTKPGVFRCLGKDCGDGADKSIGVCDKPGCDLNAFRMGNRKFIGPGDDKDINTEKKMTVVTQFLTKNSSSSGPLVDIRRLYVQNGKIFQHSQTSIQGMKKYNSITDDFCTDRAKIFGERDETGSRGGLKTMGQSLARGMVLIFSLWDDSGDSAMQWLDGARWPKNVSLTAPGVARGTCDGRDSKPERIHKLFPDAAVTFSDIRVGDIGSTY